MTRHAPHPADLKPGPRTGYDLEDLAPAPRPAADDAGPAPGRVPAPFARDRFLLRQKLVAINQKYFVQDEDGRPILYVERPSHVGRNLLALLAALGALALFGVAGVALAMSLPDRSALAPWVAIGGFGLGVVACVAIGVALSPKRHVTFYADATKGRPLLRVYQDRRWQLPVATYTIADGADQLLAILRKNVLHDLVRRKWQVIGPDGSLLCHAQEEASIFRCLARRVARQYVPVRINFVFLTPPEPGRPAARLGVFNRKLTLLDRYVLDLSADRAERLDRRVALALGVMLDSAERR